MGIITKSQYRRINLLVPPCELAIDICGRYLLACHVIFLRYRPLVSRLLWLLLIFLLICLSFTGTDGTLSCMTSYYVCNAIFTSIMLHAGDMNVRVLVFFLIIALDF